MPKLCDIVKPGVPAKVVNPELLVFAEWTGYALRSGQGWTTVTESILFSDKWQLDEPTVESVLRECGYEQTLLSDRCLIRRAGGFPSLCINPHERPTDAKQAKYICDFLDQYK